jgi:MFS family permease
MSDTTLLHDLILEAGHDAESAALVYGARTMGYGALAYFGTGLPILGLYALMAVVGIGWASVVSLPFAIMSDSVDKTRMGLFMGLFNLSVVIPQILVSVGIGSFVDDAADKNLVFIICAASLAISAVLWALLREDRAEPGEIAMGGGGHH